jgi:hypothetical protein
MRQALPPLIEALLDPGTLSRSGGAGRTHRDARLVAAAGGRFRLQDQEAGRPALSRLRHARARRPAARPNCASTAALRRSSIWRWCPSSAARPTRRSAAPAPQSSLRSSMRRFAEGRPARPPVRARSVAVADRSPISPPRSPLSTRREHCSLPRVSANPNKVLAPALENFDELPDAAARRPQSSDAWLQLADGRAANSTACAALRARKAAGRVRECHGDLHLGNLVLIDGRVTLFDCIEFSEDLALDRRRQRDRFHLHRPARPASAGPRLLAAQRMAGPQR